MPVSLADLEEPTRTIQVKFARNVLTLTYRRHATTPVKQARWVRELATPGEGQLMELVRAICELVVEWDLVGPLPADGSVVPAGEPVPLEPEIVAHIPTQALIPVFMEIMEDIKLPNPTNAGRSRSG